MKTAKHMVYTVTGILQADGTVSSRITGEMTGAMII